jgi:hypothetical protein
MTMKGSGVYIIRTRKPHAPLGLPLIGRHVGYVGQTNSFDHRIRQHLYGGGKYMAKPKPWADLSPKVRYIHLPPWRWLMLAVELALIWTLCPVYNVQRQPVYNIRRIRSKAAARQRATRDRMPLAWLLPLAVRWAVLAPVAVVLYFWMVNR